MRAVLVLGAMVAAGPDSVSEGLHQLDQNCVIDQCKAPMKACKNAVGKGGKDCAKRFECSFHSGEFEDCFTGLKWSQLEDDEIKIFDCAKNQGCLGIPTPGMSFIEVEQKSRNLVSHKELQSQMAWADQTEKLVEGMKSKAMAQARIEAAQNMLVSEARKMIKENRDALDEVLADKDLDPKLKLSAMDKLQADLQNIKTHVSLSMNNLMHSVATHMHLPHPSSLAQVRPSSMSEEEEGAGMGAEATQQMNSMLHTWEKGVKTPSLMQAANTDESTQMIQKAHLQKDFENSFRESYRESMAKHMEVDASGNLRSEGQ